MLGLCGCLLILFAVFARPQEPAAIQSFVVVSGVSSVVNKVYY